MKVIALMVLGSVLALPMALPIQARGDSPQSYTIQLPPPPNFSSIDWLVGDWTGKTEGKEPQGQVLLSVSYELDRHFMLFREEISLEATKKTPAMHEGLMGILNADPSGKGFDVNFYSSNGFITHYRVSVNEGAITFTPQGGTIPPPGVLFRRTIFHSTPGQCTERVEVAPPGKAFFNFYTASLTQVTPQSAPSSAPASTTPAESAK
ncbi:MAG: hypothetical protein ACRD1N_09275 [Terriglobia bacterium]